MPHNNGPGFRPVGGFAEASPGFARLSGAELTAFVPHRPQRPEKSEGGRRFKLVSDYQPAGDQPVAIEELVAGLGAGGASDERDQVLLGVTGSGKTFTMAKVIERVQRPALILAPNKTLAAQLYSEMSNYFPDNAVEYFVSYYDYYQPEAYIARTDTYIEKDSSVNEQIDRMRHSATRAILERDDVIIVASVSCIYGIGAVETYSGMAFGLARGQRIPRADLLARLVALQFRRNDEGFARGCFRVRGDTVDIFPAHYEDRAWRVTLFGDEVDSIFEFDPLTGRNAAELETVKIYANSHYVTPRPTLAQAVKGMREELRLRLDWFRNEGKLLEAQRLEQRTMFDLEMIEATGSCAGIENYSRWLTGRRAGEPPPTLFEYLPEEAVVFVDESHVTIPQLGGMYRGDFRRKATLAEYGFRLPSCIDNRPLKFEEWELMRPQTIFLSATPGPWELARTGGVFTEQVIRPTGLIDPPVEVRPVEYQVDDLLAECKRVAKDGYRALVTTLTKRMAEDLTEYLHENGVRVRYMHSDVETLERIEIVRDLRLGAFDVLVGINLLREGLDIPECALVAILDADKEGFLRSETSLVQTIGRAARNVDGRVILYADHVTGSMERAMAETDRRRQKQREFNLANGITPLSIKKNITDIMASAYERDHVLVEAGFAEDPVPIGHNLRTHIAELEKRMREAAGNLEFEEAARLRDEIKRLQVTELAIADDPFARQSAVEASVDSAMRSSPSGDPHDSQGAAARRAFQAHAPYGARRPSDRAGADRRRAPRLLTYRRGPARPVPRRRRVGVASRPNSGGLFMQNCHLAGLMIAGSVALAASAVGIAQSAPVPAAAPPAPLVILDFKPTLSDLMTMLIQPRHQKLWAAGQQRNWTLAAFELREMRAGFDKIAATIPKYINIDLGPTFINIMDSQVRAVNGAITSQNSTLFNTAFADLTGSCNSCHEALNHGFLVMKVPEVTGYPNQDFRALPAAAAPAAAKGK